MFHESFLLFVARFCETNSRLNGLSLWKHMESSYFDEIGLDRKCLAWLAFGAISGGWRGTWLGLAGRVCICAYIAMCHCISVSIGVSVSMCHCMASCLLSRGAC
jgi:hypothetical protein